MTMTRPLRHHSRGYTLMEVLIVVVIIGILSAIALPTYGAYVLRANRTVGKTLALRIVGQQEAYFTDRKQYATALNTLATDYSAATMYVKRDGRVQATNTSDTIYSVTLTGASATAYSVQLTPINAQAKDTSCGTLTYASTGTKTVSGSATDCWTR